MSSVTCHSCKIIQSFKNLVGIVVLVILNDCFPNCVTNKPEKIIQPNELVTSNLFVAASKPNDSMCEGNLVVFRLSGMIKLVSKHRAQLIYTRNTKGGDEETAAEKS